MKSVHRASVFAVHSAVVVRAEGSCQTINLRFGQVNGCLLSYQLQCGLGAPQESRIW